MAIQQKHKSNANFGHSKHENCTTDPWKQKQQQHSLFSLLLFPFLSFFPTQRKQNRKGYISD